MEKIHGGLLFYRIVQPVLLLGCSQLPLEGYPDYIRTNIRKIVLISKNICAILGTNVLTMMQQE